MQPVHKLAGGAQIFDKALVETTFTAMYAQFCSELNKNLPEFEDPDSEDGKMLTFRRILLNKCQVGKSIAGTGLAGTKRKHMQCQGADLSLHLAESRAPQVPGACGDHLSGLCTLFAAVILPPGPTGGWQQCSGLWPDFAIHRPGQQVKSHLHTSGKDERDVVMFL